jgi:aspartyl-tRNA(Asn)/glutamyl-tRNA(Gln) amidotransferase subunit A
MDLLRSIGRAADAVRSGEVSATELTELALRRAEDARDLNAVITLCAERALAQAKRPLHGPLAGVPWLAKDIFDTAGVRTTYGSKVFRDNVPASTASAVERIEQAGAVLIGKANLHEFAWGVTSQNEHYGDVRNPRLPAHTPGGSSGGSAAALAAGVVPISLGSDTGGSVRLPAACCGVVGFKGLIGTVPTDGCFPLASTFDVVGPMATTVQDAALLWEVLTGQAPPVPRLRGLRVGVVDDGDVRIADALSELGAEVVEYDLRFDEEAYDICFMGDARDAHARIFPAHRDEYGEAARAKWDRAQQVDAEQLLDARERILRDRARFRAQWDVDLVAGPVLGMEIPPFDVAERDMRYRFGLRARCWNALDVAAIAVGGVQLAGLDESTVLGAAMAWEEAHSAQPAPPAGSTAKTP